MKGLTWLAGLSRNKRLILNIGLWLMATVAAAQAPSQFPAKAIRILVAGAAGGSSDVQARLIAQEMGRRLAQPIIVENYGGAGGMIAAQMVVKAPADGYTLLFGYQGPLAADVSLFKNMTYDPAKDFSLITTISFYPNVIAVSPDLPAKSVSELVELLKANPGKYSFASGGIGTSQHLSGELFQIATGTKLNHVPYKGDAPAIADVISGQIPITFTSPVTAIPQARAGKLRLLAVTSSSRLPILPDIPTVAESGYPNFEITSWFAFAAPKGTPAAVIDKLNLVIGEIVHGPLLTGRINSYGGVVKTMKPEEFDSFLAKDIPRWSELVQRSNAQVN